jgi:hypothetical protein
MRFRVLLDIKKIRNSVGIPPPRIDAKTKWNAEQEEGTTETKAIK